MGRRPGLWRSVSYAPPPFPDEDDRSLEELLDLPLQLFARDHLNLALVNFLGSTSGPPRSKAAEPLVLEADPGFRVGLAQDAQIIYRSCSSSREAGGAQS